MKKRLTLVIAGSISCTLANAAHLTVPVDGCAGREVKGAECSLRTAIEYVNENAGSHVISLEPGGVYTLDSVDHHKEHANGLPAIRAEVHLQGNGATLMRDETPGTPEFRLLRVAPDGQLLITDLTLRNGATKLGFDGAALWNVGTTVLERVQITENHSGDDGGGIRNDGTLTIRDSVVSRNTAGARGGSGGGLYAQAQYGPGVVSIERSAFVENSTQAAGGAIWTEGSLSVVSSTFSGNRAENRGGALQNYGDVTLRNVTITNNSAAIQAGGVYNYASLVASNTIIGGNKSMMSMDYWGALASDGHNLLSEVYGSRLVRKGDGDIFGESPLLLPLQVSPGQTPVHPLSAHSPARNQGSPARLGSSVGACVPTDQQGRARDAMAAGRCDMGAFEDVAATLGTSDAGAGTAEPRDLSAAAVPPAPVGSLVHERKLSVQGAEEDDAILQQPALHRLRELGARVIVRKTGDEPWLEVTLDSAWEGGNRGLAYLQDIELLRKLKVSGRLDEEGLSYIGKLDQLEGLDLHVIGLRSGDLSFLTGLSRLQRLNLSYAPITDAAVEHLTQLRQLVWLGLLYTKVSEQGAERLRRALPETLIEGSFRS
ncbi:MAG: choice-of-anchor Q domain-containing protein [Pseudomonadota bacterium]